MIDCCYIEITNTCNLNRQFLPLNIPGKKRQLGAEEFNLLTDKIKGKVCFLHFHLMGEPLLHPLLPQFITTAREKGFKTVLTSNGTLLHRAMELLEHFLTKYNSHFIDTSSNAKGETVRLYERSDDLLYPSSSKGNLHRIKTVEPRRK